MIKSVRNLKLLSPFIVFLAFLIVATPITITKAQTEQIKEEQPAGNGCMDGEARAAMDISGSTWFIIGCLAGLIGYLIAMQEPNPPATDLLGKSPEYVASYTDCYRQKGASIKKNNALMGCIIGNAVTLGAYVIILAAASSE